MVLRAFKKGEHTVKNVNIERVDRRAVDEGGNGFGILIRCPSGRSILLHSVCVRREDAERICETVNRLIVSECHVYDVIEDLLP